MRKAKPYRGWADIQPLNDNPTNEKIKPCGLLEQGQVRVKDVLVLPSHEELDDGLVTSIAESFPFSGGGPFNPIIVRRVREQENGEEVIKTVLVAGAQRLQAVRLTGIEYVNCVYIEGDETEPRLVQIAEDLFRKDLTVLRRADMLAEWLALALLNFSGQLVQKGQGRSLAGLARAACVLPAIGRSVEARRKIIDRAVLIARLPPEVKKAVKKARLDNNQWALLKIAKVKGRKAQLAKVEVLAGRSEKSSVLPIQTGKAATSSRNGLQGSTSGAVQSPPLQSVRAPPSAATNLRLSIRRPRPLSNERRRSMTWRVFGIQMVASFGRMRHSVSESSLSKSSAAQSARRKSMLLPFCVMYFAVGLRFASGTCMHLQKPKGWRRGLFSRP